MGKKNAALVGAALLCTALGASAALSQQPDPPPASGAEKVCLQANRMWSYNVPDERTLQVTDRSYKRYTVRLAGGCVGLTNAVTDVVFRAKTSLGCLGPGDTIAFTSPGIGRLSCFIIGVENYVPPEAKKADEPPH